MKELIGMAVVVATIFGGTTIAEKIFVEVKKAALVRAAQGLPKLSPFASNLTNRTKVLNDKKLKR